MANRDEDAPWLAEAAPLRAPAPKRPILNIAIAVLALGAVAAVALLMLLGRRDGGSTQGYMEASQAPLIEADPGPYKVPPADRQGMEVDGEGEVIHEAVRGENPGSVIDMGALPEEPVGRPRDLLPPGSAPPATAPATAPVAGQPVPVQVVPVGQPAAAPRAVPTRPAPGPTAQPAAPPIVRPAPAAAAPAPVIKPPPVASAPAKPVTPVAKPVTAPAKSGSGMVQIGAFSSEAKAEEEWSRVAGKGGLSGKKIQKVTSSSGKEMWRVRGSAADVDAACKAILAAKGACEAVKK
ncbi:MAG: hypothetical protein RIS17_1405 [Pseudomonadota bacterium]|jgi:hypothetical protein